MKFVMFTIKGKEQQNPGIYRYFKSHLIISNIAFVKHYSDTHAFSQKAFSSSTELIFDRELFEYGVLRGRYFILLITLSFDKLDIISNI